MDTRLHDDRPVTKRFLMNHCSGLVATGYDGCVVQIFPDAVNYSTSHDAFMSLVLEFQLRDLNSLSHISIQKLR